MSESFIDNHRERYDPAFDAMMTIEQSIKARADRLQYEWREWHKMHDAPPPGYGIDGYPLMRGKET